jgi:hypothetical protein
VVAFAIEPSVRVVQRQSCLSSRLPGNGRSGSVDWFGRLPATLSGELVGGIDRQAAFQIRACRAGSQTEEGVGDVGAQAEVAVTVTVVVDVEAQAEEEMMVLGWPRKRRRE